MTETKRLADELEALAKECDAYPEGPGHVNRMYDLGERTRNNLPLILTTLREAEGMRAALEKHDEAIKGLPCLPGRPLPDICPRCGATSRDVCGPTMAADYIFVEAARLALSQGGGE